MSPCVSGNRVGCCQGPRVSRTPPGVPATHHHSPTHIHPKICSQRRPRILFPGRTTTIRKHKPGLCNPSSSLPAAANDLRWLKGRDSGSQRSGLATSSITSSSCDAVRFSLQRQNLNSNRRHRRCKACHNKYLSTRVVQY